MQESRNPTAPRNRWLFSPTVDVSVFLGSAVLSLLLLAVGARYGLLNQDTPEWTWITTVLLVDVAHVYATAFRVYFVPDELHRRPFLYLGTPILCFLVGVAIHAVLGPIVFWRLLAYVAVFHFVRQQYGWVALYRSRCGERDALGRWIDTLTIYLATIYPLVHWHANLPRGFAWFIETDFQPIPTAIESSLRPVYWGMLAAYAANSVRNWFAGRGNPGKDIVVVTTAVCWYLGIVAFNSDYAFTVTNVVIHGVPYIALVYYYALRRRSGDVVERRFDWRSNLFVILATIWFLAYAEELLWDRALWMERSWLFGEPFPEHGWRGVLEPLLATPQLVHYVLDGFIWRRRSNPGLDRTVNGSAS